MGAFVHSVCREPTLAIACSDLQGPIACCMQATKMTISKEITYPVAGVTILLNEKHHACRARGSAIEKLSLLTRRLPMVFHGAQLVGATFFNRYHVVHSCGVCWIRILNDQFSPSPQQLDAL